MRVAELLEEGSECSDGWLEGISSSDGTTSERTGAFGVLVRSEDRERAGVVVRGTNVAAWSRISSNCSGGIVRLAGFLLERVLVEPADEERAVEDLWVLLDLEREREEDRLGEVVPG